MMHMEQQSTMKSLPKSYSHVMKTQMSMKEGIKTFIEEGNNALLKQFNQLHEQKSLLPKRK